MFPSFSESLVPFVISTAVQAIVAYDENVKNLEKAISDLAEVG
jgi:hypothetical protein